MVIKTVKNMEIIRNSREQAQEDKYQAELQEKRTKNCDWCKLNPTPDCYFCGHGL